MLDKLGMEFISQDHLLEEELGEIKLRRKHIDLDKGKGKQIPLSLYLLIPLQIPWILMRLRRINKQIVEKMEKEPEGSEYLNIVSEGKYENVGETLDTGATFSTVTEMQAEVEKAQQTYEEIESLEDSHIVSFPKLDKEKEALRRKTQGERVPFETEDLLTSLTNITEPPPIAFTDPSDFDEVFREGDEYLGKIEEELGNEERKQILSRVEKGFAKL